MKCTVLTGLGSRAVLLSSPRYSSVSTIKQQVLQQHTEVKNPRRVILDVVKVTKYNNISLSLIGKNIEVDSLFTQTCSLQAVNSKRSVAQCLNTFVLQIAVFSHFPHSSGMHASRTNPVLTSTFKRAGEGIMKGSNT